jgi:mannose-1-phosphate guanylyltransferase
MAGQERAWVILLAGGEGTRLRGTTVGGIRFDRPKQFCRFDDHRTLLAIALERARRMTDSSRILPVVCGRHREWWQPELATLPPENVLAQPDNRGNAVAIFHALFQILRRDENPVVLLLPSDHAVEEEAILAGAVSEAARTVRAPGQPIVLLGMTPENADPQYGWILPGAAEGATRRVEAFHEKPSDELAAALMRRGALWNTFIFACTALGLLRLFEETRPDLLETYPGSLLGSEQDPLALARFYERLGAIDFSRDILAKAAHRLRLMPVPPCGWTDLGTPVRVEAWLRRRDRAAATASYGRGTVCEMARM